MRVFEVFVEAHHEHRTSDVVTVVVDLDGSKRAAIAYSAQ